jgi:GNAT superfamily N-acetyltransferase
MSTSVETLSDGTAVGLRAVPYDDPVAVDLVDRVQQEYVARYGGPDEAAVEPDEFVPPGGLFLVAEVGGEPAGCGAWRVYPPGGVEIKRVYVAPEFRRRGLAQLIVAALESSASAAGHPNVVLNTGDRQPEAIALYTDLGYSPVQGYGVYACSPGAVFLGKDLVAGPDGGQSGDIGEGYGEEERSWAS